MVTEMATAWEHRNGPNGLKGDRWAQQVVATCLPMIEAGADLSDACTKVENMLSTLPKDDLGRPILPRRGDGKLDMKELFDRTGPGPMGLSHPARPANLAELQTHLGLTDGNGNRSDRCCAIKATRAAL